MIEDIILNITADDSIRRFPGMFPTLAGALEQVCVCVFLFCVCIFMCAGGEYFEGV
jgi:hypothetical protein